MSNKQALNKYRSKARARPKHHQPIPSQYDVVKLWIRSKKAWSSSRERKKTYSKVPAQVLLGEMSCQDDIPPKRSKGKWEPLDACHEGQRERAPTPQQVRMPRQTNKQNSHLCLVVGVAQLTQMNQWWSASTPRPDKGG